MGYPPPEYIVILTMTILGVNLVFGEKRDGAKRGNMIRYCILSISPFLLYQKYNMPFNILIRVVASAKGRRQKGRQDILGRL